MNSVSGNQREGQTNVVSAVIITGLLAGAILTVYSWGMPMLQKQKDINQVDDALENVKSIAKNIETVATKEGSRYSTIQVDGFLEINASSNSIIYTTKSSKAYVATDKWVTLRENDMRGIPGIKPDEYGIKGRDKPGVIIAKAKKAGNNYITVFKLFFRELIDTNSRRGYQIDLKADGPDSVSSGSHKVKVAYRDSNPVPGGSKVGSMLEEKIVEVTIE